MLNIKKNSVGLDIADRSIEIVQLNKSGRQVKLISLGRARLAPGIVERGQIKNAQKLAQVLDKVLSSAIPQAITARSLIFGLPEALVYTHVAQLKPGNQAQFKKLSSKDKDVFVRKEALKLIPLESSDLLLDYRVRSVDKGKLSLLIVGASRKTVAAWQNFFTDQNIDVVFDIESLAIARGLFDKPLEAGVCVVDIGAITSMIMIFDPAGLRYSYQMGQAGRVFTQVIKRKFNNSYEEAEKLKLQSGLSDTDSEIYSALVNPVTKLVGEIKTMIKYYRRTTGMGIEEIVLVGGSSRLKGLAEFIEENIGLATRLGTAYLAQDKVTTSARYMYIEAIGLAWRGLVSKWERQDPEIKLLTQEPKNIPLRPTSTEGSGGQAKTQKGSDIKPESVGQAQNQKIKNINPPRINQPKSLPNTELARKLRQRKIFLAVAIIILGIVASVFYWFSQPAKIRQAELAKPGSAQPEPVDGLNLEIPIIGEQNGSLSNTTTKQEVLEQGETQVADNLEPAAVEQIIITKTPTGWLNVRSGPGTNFEILTKVLPGETYPLLKEQDNWYNIKVDDQTSGWVINIYSKKSTSTTQRTGL